MGDRSQISDRWWTRGGERRLLSQASPLPDGLASFKSFLRSEFSEENLDFWMACEDYKKATSPAQMAEKARRMYEEFIRSQAPREVGAGGGAGRPGRCEREPRPDLGLGWEPRA